MSRRKAHQQIIKSIDADTYQAMLEMQDGHCAICPNTPKTRRLHVDHDHKRMIVRGLLCHRCNRALASWVTPQWLRAAAEYLEVAEEYPIQ